MNEATKRLINDVAEVRTTDEILHLLDVLKGECRLHDVDGELNAVITYAELERARKGFETRQGVIYDERRGV